MKTVKNSMASSRESDGLWVDDVEEIKSLSK